MIRKHGPWLLVSLLGAWSLAMIAMVRGENVNALWVVAAAISVYVLAYRYYSLFISRRVMQLDPNRLTPAHTRSDGLDYVPTNKGVLFGHHFAAIAGAGPLVGPVLAAQMGYLPGVLWIVMGVVLAGAVQDFMILFVSMRRDGRSLGELIRSELGPVAGVLALFGAFMIMIIILGVLSLIVVRALTDSPWGVFTVGMTIPIAVFMGVYMRWIRPGRIGEGSIIGLVGLVLAVVFGRHVAESAALAPLFGYGAVAASLPIWLLLAPRDYLSTFMKIGAVVMLAVGFLIVGPELQMPPITKFIDGTGPVWAGSLFPFLFITIACGAVSGFHSLISSGTTPKMINNEMDARFIGYAGMLMESFVAVMAIMAASILDPGIYFAMNSPAALMGTTAETAAAAVTAMGFPITPEALTGLAADVGETTIISRTGGAPTLAVGMAHVFSQFLGGQAMMAFWYHFAILFEALFILTAVDAGTRAGRFMLQDLLGLFMPAFRKTEALAPNIIATVLCVGAWGFILYQGVTDPLGGVNTLWPMFGIANQMLAAIALILATVVIFKMKRQRYAWVTMLPMSWLLVCTLTAGWQKLFSPDPKIGFLAHARQFSEALAQNTVLAPAANLNEMSRIIFNDYLNSTLCALFVLVVLGVLSLGIKACITAMRTPEWTARETPEMLAPAE
jgi:carbon starvation protein